MTAYGAGTLGKSRLGISMLNSDLEWEQGQSKVGRHKGAEGPVTAVQKSTEFVFQMPRVGLI